MFVVRKLDDGGAVIDVVVWPANTNRPTMGWRTTAELNPVAFGTFVKIRSVGSALGRVCMNRGGDGPFARTETEASDHGRLFVDASTRNTVEEEEDSAFAMDTPMRRPMENEGKPLAIIPAHGA